MSGIIPGLISIWKILWRVGLFFITWGLFLSLFFVPFGPKLMKWQQTSPIEAKLCIELASILTILLATWLMTKFVDHRPFLSIGLNIDNIYWDAFNGFTIGIAWLGISIGILWSFGWASPVEPIGFSWSILTGSIIAMLLNVITQELLLCGFIFQTIRSRSNVITAIIISALLFSGYHFGAFNGNWLPALNVFGAGVLFCVAYVITGKLWFPIAIHLTWDVLLGPVLGLTESGKSDLGGSWKMFTINGPSLFTGGNFGLEGGLIVTITTTIILVIIYYFYYRKIIQTPVTDSSYISN